MIIPVRCFTCGKVLADKYQNYQESVRAKKLQQGINENKVLYLTKEYIEKTPEGIAMDELKIKKACCRRHFLTHVDIE
jgi:DNA-directed RNA polymerase I, II, and III subunit RPABC5